MSNDFWLALAFAALCVVGLAAGAGVGGLILGSRSKPQPIEVYVHFDQPLAVKLQEPPQ
jgi:hypothetical protein